MDNEKEIEMMTTGACVASGGFGAAVAAGDSQITAFAEPMSPEFGGVAQAAHGVKGNRSCRPRTIRAGWPGTDQAWAGASAPATQRVFSAAYYSD